MQTRNELGQPVGVPLPDWSGASVPDRTTMLGRMCRLEALDADRHAEALHAAYSQNSDAANWTYLPYGPFASVDEYAQFVTGIQRVGAPCFFAIVDLASETPVGVASYLRDEPTMGAIEVGHLSYSPALQRTPVSTEAMFLMMKRVFDDWGYRRYEWKCDSLNGPSVAAAKRAPLSVYCSPLSLSSHGGWGLPLRSKRMWPRFFKSHCQPIFADCA